jgi:uridine kinase
MIAARPGSGDPLIVSLYGPSCAGKSQTAKVLAAHLGEECASRVPADPFVVPRSAGMLMADYRAQPLAWDWALIARRLALPIGTATSTPDFDFDAFTRRSDIGGMAFTVRPVMILDAVAPFPGAGLSVLLAVPDEVRRERIVARDRRWGSRVVDTWDHLQATWAAVHAAAPAPDLVVDATRPIGVNVADIAGAIDALM